MKVGGVVSNGHIGTLSAGSSEGDNSYSPKPACET